MKKFLKTLAVIVAVAALGFGFASCSDDDDGGSGSSALAAFTYTDPVFFGGSTETIYFYADNTWVRETVFPQVNNYTEKNMSGTYKLASGDFTNGKLDFTVVEKDRKKLDWKEVSLEINNGVFYLDVHSSGTVDVNDETSCDKYVKQ